MDSRKTSHTLFILMIIARGVDGTVQLIIGVLALLFSKGGALYNSVMGYLNNQIATGGDTGIAKYLVNAIQSLTSSTQQFFALYIILHGVVKLFIVYNILKKKYWAYPLAIVAFSAFAIYQTYLYISSPSIIMAILIVMDVVTAILTYIEYRNIKNPKAA